MVNTTTPNIISTCHVQFDWNVISLLKLDQNNKYMGYAFQLFSRFLTEQHIKTQVDYFWRLCFSHLDAGH